MVDIALYRHGITKANRTRTYCGWDDLSLGEDEAHRISPAHKEYDQFFSSDLKRCQQTCLRLFPHSEPTLLKEFREMNFGSWEGHTYESLKHDLHYQKWLDDPDQIAPPDGEGLDEFQERIMQGWSKILADRKGRRLALVTHGGVIRSLLHRFAPVPKNFWEWEVPFAAGYELTFTESQLRRGERCTSLQEVPSTGSVLG
ncbi:histidine phosphatase family protein [Pseudalkalibacillus sp. Hm43]|uniref:histidine phosphatase family protein n=1 Tax=Pseudalkalibacillus sp. Hm43 TaxID=3450742 RepID=UPI003F4415EA